MLSPKILESATDYLGESVNVSLSHEINCLGFRKDYKKPRLFCSQNSSSNWMNWTKIKPEIILEKGWV